MGDAIGGFIVLALIIGIGGAILSMLATAIMMIVFIVGSLLGFNMDKTGGED